MAYLLGHFFQELREWMHCLGLSFWLFRISFIPLISTLLEKLIDWSWLQCCLQLVNLTEIFEPWNKLREHETRVSLCCWNLVHGTIKSLVQQQVFLQSVASIHLSKHGIYAQLRCTHFSVMAQMYTDFIHPRPLGVQSLKDCWVANFSCSFASEKYGIIFHFKMMKSTFSAT